MKQPGSASIDFIENLDVDPAWRNIQKVKPKFLLNSILDERLISNSAASVFLDMQWEDMPQALEPTRWKRENGDSDPEIYQEKELLKVRYGNERGGSELSRLKVDP